MYIHIMHHVYTTYSIIQKAEIDIAIVTVKVSNF